MADTTRQFAEAIAQMPQPNDQVEHLGCLLCDFSSHNFDRLKVLKGPM
jgi:hypothetical protein